MIYEKSKDFNDKNSEKYNEKGRMWRMSDILSIRLQDILYSGKSEL